MTCGSDHFVCSTWQSDGNTWNATPQVKTWPDEPPSRASAQPELTSLLLLQAWPTSSHREAIFEVLNMYVVSNDTSCFGLEAQRCQPPLLTHVHCCVHREALAAERMWTKQSEQWIRLKSRHLVALLTEDMGPADYGQITKSAGCLTRSDHFYWLAGRLCHSDWFCKLARLANIFNHLNGLNLVSSHNLPCTQVWKATVKKIDVWEKRLARTDYESFENVSRVFGWGEVASQNCSSCWWKPTYLNSQMQN